MLTVTLIGAGVPGSHKQYTTDASNWGQLKREIGSEISFSGKAATLIADETESELADSDTLPTEGNCEICLTVVKQKAGK